ncbi:TatD family hydrolase [Blattabacterium cuenoti]|uniref:TatD family hydrolase n=1 Tax=Blattabacterium cuenoti TaxID=1653831 RepID=UPI00293BE447|nr:TatD family hydrolase [Blattabacterium cuenoti]
MINITDTHAHLYMKEFDKDRELVIKRAIYNGIKRFFIPSTELLDIPTILELKKNYTNICFPMIGLHPNKVNLNYKIELQKIKKYLELYSFISIGEIGIDLYYNNKLISEQIQAFKIQIELAKNYKLPIIIHCRNAFDIILNIIKTYYPIKGIFHCFCGTLKQATQITDLGIKLGIGGMITFKNNHMISFLNKISLKNIVLETDCPYLAPTPFRGTRNEPTYLIKILQELSKIYSISEIKISNIINLNIDNIFSNIL